MQIGSQTAAAVAAQLLSEHPRGWSLPQPFYNDEEIFALDMQHVFAASWIFVANTCEVPGAGDWVRVDFGDESIVVIRGNDGTIRAFYNTCRHRGSLICLDSQGHSR